MPPLSPPPGCQDKMKTRADDNLTTIKRRLEVRLLVISNDHLSQFHGRLAR